LTALASKRPKPITLGLVASAWIAAATSAQGLTIDFVNGTWDHSCGGGSSGSTGWDNTYTCGSLTDGSLVATLNMSFFGTAAGHSSNAEFLSSSAFEGFLLGNVSSSDDGNTGSTLSNYQQWLFTFNQAVTVQNLTVTDIDESGWIDAVGLETFTGPFIGAGNHDSMIVSLGASLQTVNGFGLDYYRASVTGNTTKDPDNALVATSTQAVDGFAVYLFNAGTDNGQHGVGVDATFDLSGVATVPGPATLALLMSSVGGLAVARQRRQSA